MKILDNGNILSEVYPQGTAIEFRYLLEDSPMLIHTNEALEERFEGPLANMYNFLLSVTRDGTPDGLTKKEPGLKELYMLTLKVLAKHTGE